MQRTGRNTEIETRKIEIIFQNIPTIITIHTDTSNNIIQIYPINALLKMIFNYIRIKIDSLSTN